MCFDKSHDALGVGGGGRWRWWWLGRSGRANRDENMMNSESFKVNLLKYAKTTFRIFPLALCPLPPTREHSKYQVIHMAGRH